MISDNLFIFFNLQKKKKHKKTHKQKRIVIIFTV